MGIYSSKTQASKQPFTLLEGVLYDKKGRHLDDYENMNIPFEKLRLPSTEDEAIRYNKRFFKEFGKKYASIE